MATNFPTSVDAFSTITNPSTIVPADRVNDIADSVEAIETKIGTTNSVDNSSIDYLLKNTASTPA